MPAASPKKTVFNSTPFEKLNSVYKKCILGLICCHYRLYPEVINATFRYYGLSRPECTCLWSYIRSNNWLTEDLYLTFTEKGVSGDHFYNFIRSFTQTANFQPIKMLNALESLNGDCSIFNDAELKKAWAKGASKTGLQDTQRFKDSEYAWMLKRIITKGKISNTLRPKSLKDDEDFTDDPQTSATEFKPLFISMMLKSPEYNDFFNTCSTLTLKTVLENCSSFAYSAIPAVLAQKLLKGFAKVKDSEQYKIFNSWILMQEFFYEGNVQKFIELIPDGVVEHFILLAFSAYQDGKAADAVKLMRKALTLQKNEQDRASSSERFFWRDYENWLYGLFLYSARMAPANAKSISAILKDKNNDYFENALLTIFCALAEEKDPADYVNPFIEKASSNTLNTPLQILMYESIRYGLHAKTLNCDTRLDSQTLQKCTQTGELYPVFFQTFLAVTSPDSPMLYTLEKRLKMKPLITFTKEKPEWERLIDKVLEYETQNGSTLPGKKAVQNLDRYAYYLTFHQKDEEENRACSDPDFSIRFQHSRNGGETWNKGREVKLQHFKEAHLPSMTPTDLAVAARIEVNSYQHWNRRLITNYTLSGPLAASELIGYPYVYDASTNTPLEVVKGAVQLSVQVKNKKFVIITNVDKLMPEDPQEKLPVWMIEEPSDGKVTVYELTADQQRILSELRKIGEMPDAAKNKLTVLLETISSKMPVMSDLLKSSDKLKKIAGNSHILLQLTQPSAGSFEAHTVIHPAEGSKLTCEPGVGQEFIATVVDGANVQIHRDLKGEKQNFSALEEILTPLDECREDRNLWIMDTEQCLHMLDLVRDNKLCTVQWPEGEKFKVSKPPLDFPTLKLSVRSMGSWFEVSGEVKIDDNTKMQVAELMRLVRHSQGSFISLGNNEYMALTEKLKKQISLLDKMASADAKKVKISRFNSGVLDELEKNGSDIKADKQYKDLKKRIEQASTISPSIPKKLNASLRDYQEEGFEWMMKLASWGAGAVLADDMGLGKTVQTISVLLARASLGAQLVVVPAALLINWKNELNRFAPSLKPVILNFEAERSKQIQKAAKNSVLLVTYGVVSEEIKELSEKAFATAVFDEAHNIKNRDTKAFKSCAQLNADFRIMLTGTPLQNHLTEIWSLFEIAVPGLLGSFNSFSDRFVLPVERDHDTQQQRLLKRIVSPFILRRTKADVLSELPDKTEITIEVELSDEEKALYDHIREETASSLQDGVINPVQALAALTKLRQAACSMELIDSKLTVRSSKTEAFLNLVDELIENNHRALVFSQFTSHLAIIKRELDKKNIEYLYLDGSMSSKERMKLVEKFDEGTMPLFLISLKAGGTGLNLTAADYVIHLDPWWNPAIEEQASDRAYRIGQQRQVTVYRLIAKGTVEDKILKLHSTKKSLADALLEGTEMSTKLGREEIMELLELAGH
ncbi:MAG: SNF2 family helicase [Succinatimonas sp.]|nr:SNF2 family helicase [Succinatimonas sp.]